MAFGVTEVDYGEQGPEHFDRFGIRHYAHVYSRHRNSIFVDANLHGIVKRLGLTLMGWAKRYYNVYHYFLDIHGRPLEIRSYSDGRIKLFLDGACVYAENTKIVTRHGVKHREIEQWFDPAVTEEEAEDQRQTQKQARLDAVREMLKQRRAGETSSSPRGGSHGDTSEEDDTTGQEGRTSTREEGSGPGSREDSAQAASGQASGQEGRS